jgi:hypothetical protein
MQCDLFFVLFFLLLAAKADDFSWPASVHNINLPSSEGLSADARKA